MSLFRKSFIESVLTFDLISWFGSLHIRGKVASWRWPARCCVSHTPHWEFTRRSSANPVCKSTLPHLEVESLTSGCRFKVPQTKYKRIEILYTLCSNSLKWRNVLCAFYCGVLWVLVWCVVLHSCVCAAFCCLPDCKTSFTAGTIKLPQPVYHPQRGHIRFSAPTEPFSSSSRLPTGAKGCATMFRQTFTEAALLLLLILI